jgi:uncharacterized membrane protein
MEVMAKAVMVLVIIFLAAMVLADMEAMMVYGLTEAPLPDRKALVQTSPFQRFFFRILVWMALRTVAAALIKSQFVSIGLPHDRCILACWHSSFEWSVGDGQWIR